MKPMAMATGPKLNYDLLIEVVSHIQQDADLWSVSHTCRTLHTFATREVLRRGVSLDQKHQLASFHKFMISNRDNRAAYLDQLGVYFSASDLDDPDDSGALADILSHCHGIKQLTVDSAGVLNFDTRIGPAISALPELRVLVFRLASGVRGRDDMLAGLRTRRLVAVEIDYTFDTSDISRAHIGGDGSNPIIALHRHASTLEILCVNFGQFYSIGPQSGACYTNLTTLELENCMIPSTALLMKTFPNLRQLVTRDTVLDPDPAQDASTGTHVIPWALLDYFASPLQLAFELGIPCPVRYWVNTRTVWAWDAEEMNELISFMSNTRLARMSTILEIRNVDDLNSIVREAERLRLTHVSLRLGMQLHTPGGHGTLPDILMALASACRLVFFKIDLYYNHSRQVASALANSLAFEHHAVASRFFVVVPSLRFLALSLSTAATTNYWVRDAESTSGGVPAREVSKGEFEEYKTKEGMDEPDYRRPYFK